MMKLIDFVMKILFILVLVYNVFWGDVVRALVMSLTSIPLFLFSIELELERLNRYKN